MTYFERLRCRSIRRTVSGDSLLPLLGKKHENGHLLYQEQVPHGKLLDALLIVALPPSHSGVLR